MERRSRAPGGDTSMTTSLARLALPPRLQSLWPDLEALEQRLDALQSRLFFAGFLGGQSALALLLWHWHTGWLGAGYWTANGLVTLVIFALGRFFSARVEQRQQALQALTPAQMYCHLLGLLGPREGAAQMELSANCGSWALPWQAEAPLLCLALLSARAAVSGAPFPWQQISYLPATTGVLTRAQLQAVLAAPSSPCPKSELVTAASATSAARAYARRCGIRLLDGRELALLEEQAERQPILLRAQARADNLQTISAWTSLVWRATRAEAPGVATWLASSLATLPAPAELSGHATITLLCKPTRGL